METLILVLVIVLYCVWWFKYQYVREATLELQAKSFTNNSKWIFSKIKPYYLTRLSFKHDYAPIIICLGLISTVFITPYSRSLSIIFIFLITMITIFIRPREINEAYPATIGAIIIILTGGVSWLNIVDITDKVSGASLTIISTIIMAITLESFGFFNWVASKLMQLSKKSGYRLYWYIQILCFSMTILFNNDGSILITTPIIILVLRHFNLNQSEKIPYLVSAALMATASSAPIGVSNITNLIALKIVDMTLYMHTAMMFVPCTLGLAFMSYIMFLTVKKSLPKNLSNIEENMESKNIDNIFRVTNEKVSFNNSENRTKFMIKILSFVFGIRCLLFVASYYNVPIEIVSILGSIVLLAWRWYYLKINPMDIFKKTPWYILVFAFSMYVIIYGLENIGLIEWIVKICEPLVRQNLFNASIIMGTVVSAMSNIFNNHPALMVGTIALTSMDLSSITLKVIYLANIVGSDIGSLILPIGTLASLMWFYIVRHSQIDITWKDYLSISLKVIPLTVMVTLALLFVWVSTLFA